MRAVNLLPREPKRGPGRMAVATQLAIVSPFVVGSLVAAGYLLSSSKVNDRKATLHALQDELATLPAPAPQPRIDPGLALQRDQRVAALSAALQGRLAWDRILRELSSVLPGDVWLTTLKAESPQAPVATAPATASTTTTSSTTTDTTSTPTPAAPSGPLTLSGYTYSQEGVARFLSRLAVVPSLQDVKLVSSAQTTLSGLDVVTFTMQADVRPQETG